MVSNRSDVDFGNLQDKKREGGLVVPNFPPFVIFG